MRGIKITVMMLLISHAIVAQTKTAEEIATKKVEKIESIVELSVDQKVVISDIALSVSTQMLEHKNAGTLDKEARHKLRVAEHKQIHAVLTPEQRIALKESRKHTKEEHIVRNRLRQVDKAEVREIKNLLVEKRAAFEGSLTDAEKATIEQARNLMQDRVKGKEAKAALTVEQKKEMRVKHKHINILLKPIVENHKAELDAIEAEVPKDGNSKDKKGKNHFAQKFLLIQ